MIIDEFEKYDLTDKINDLVKSKKIKSLNKIFWIEIIVIGILAILTLIFK